MGGPSPAVPLPITAPVRTGAQAAGFPIIGQDRGPGYPMPQRIVGQERNFETPPQAIKEAQGAAQIAEEEAAVNDAIETEEMVKSVEEVIGTEASMGYSDAMEKAFDTPEGREEAQKVVDEEVEKGSDEKTIFDKLMALGNRVALEKVNPGENAIDRIVRANAKMEIEREMSEKQKEALKAQEAKELAKEERGRVAELEKIAAKAAFDSQEKEKDRDFKAWKLERELAAKGDAESLKAIRDKKAKDAVEAAKMKDNYNKRIDKIIESQRKEINSVSSQYKDYNVKMESSDEAYNLLEESQTSRG